VSERTRRIVFVVAALGVAAILLWALAGLPSFGSHESAYARLLNSTTAKRRHVTDVVTATVFDYRGAVPDTGASTVTRLGEMPRPARDTLVALLDGGPADATRPLRPHAVAISAANG